MASGARSKLGVLMFEPKVFRKHKTVLKKVLVTLPGFFGTLRSQSAPQSDSVPGELSPLALIVTPLLRSYSIVTKNCRINTKQKRT